MPSHNAKSGGNKEIVHRFMDECWSQGKLNTVSELVAANCRLHDPVFPHLTSGADNLRNHIETCRRGFPDLKFTIDDTISERDEVVVHWTANGTHKGAFMGMPPTNKKASVSGTTICRIEGGKIAEQWGHWNVMSLMEQLGSGAAAQQPQAQSHATKAESRKAESKARA
jgi:steroid delta-isomerase-like uncharacterized protein